MYTSKEIDTVAKRKVDNLKTYLIQRADIVRDDVIQKHKTLKEENRKKRIDQIRQQVIPEPGSSNSEEAFGQTGIHPFSILSPDIWETLLNKYVLDSRTWLNCFYASAALRNEEKVLKWKQNKMTRLLPEVLKILHRNESNLHLTENDLETMRLVSKSFRNIIDNHYAIYRSNDRFYRGNGPAISFDDSDIDEDIPFLVSQTSLPLSFNSFTVGPNILNDDISKITFILQNMGKGVREFIWCTKTKDKWDVPCAVQWYETLRCWLVAMPNLEYLKIRYTITKKFNWSFREKYEKFSNNLEQQLVLKALPKLDKLKILKVENTFPGQLLTAILSVSPKVEIVHVEIEYPEMVPEKILGPLWKGYSSLKLDSLTELYIQDYVRHSYFEIRNECSIVSLNNVNWPLKHLTLDLFIDPERDYGHQNIQLLFAIANNFEKTLEYLKISGAKWENSTETKKLQLSVPNLKTLYLRIEFEYHYAYQPHINVDFDFLLELPSLQSLSLKLKEYHDKIHSNVYVEESIQLQDYFDRLYESQIWKILEALQKVDISIYSHHQNSKSSNSNYKYDRIGLQNYAQFET